MSPDVLKRVSDILKQQIGEYRSPFASFFDQEPSEVLEAIKQWIAIPASQPENFEWRLLAEIARKRTFRDVSKDSIWAETAVLAYEYLAFTNPEHSYNDILSAMMLRADAILRHGDKANDSIRDLQRIIDWGMKRNLNLAQAQAIFQDVLPNREETILLLQDFEKVRILLKLFEAGILDRDKDLDGWAMLEDAYARLYFNRGKVFGKNTKTE